MDPASEQWEKVTADCTVAMAPLGQWGKHGEWAIFHEGRNVLLHGGYYRLTSEPTGLHVWRLKGIQDVTQHDGLASNYFNDPTMSVNR